MNRKNRHYLPTLTAVCAVTLALCGATAHAQGPGGRGMGGRMMGGPMMGGPMMGGSAVTLPISVLKSGLGLTESQTTKIEEIQKSFRTERQSMFGGMGRGRRGGPGGPPPGGPGGPPPGGPPPMMMQNMMKMRTAMQQDEAKIVAVLDSSQKSKLPRLLNVASALDMAGVGSGVYPELHLSASQEAKLSAIAVESRKKMQSEMMAAMQNHDFQQMRTNMQNMRAQNRTSVFAALTANQRSAATAYENAHPMRRGPGMMGGPPGPPQ